MLYTGGLSAYTYLFILFFYFRLKKYSISTTKKTFKLFYGNNYLKLIFGTSLIIIFIYYLLFNDLTNSSNNLEYSKKYNLLITIYLSFFYIILFIFNKNIFYIKILILIFFPIISISNDYRLIANCESDISIHERIVTIKPLIEVLPKTIISFFQDYKREYFRPFLNIKFYSLFQIITVLLLLPTLLISKEEKEY